MKNAVLTLCLALLIAPNLSGQSKKKTASPVNVTVKQVNDRRTTGHFSELSIGLQVPKVPSADVAAYRVLLTSAKDDTGLDLIKADRGEPGLAGNARSIGEGDEKVVTPMWVNVSLKNPARTATRIKELSGEIELYMPKKDSNSVALIPKFLSQSGKPLSSKALKANGVEVTLISKAQLEAEKKKLGDKKRKDAIAEGMEGEGLEYVVSSFLEYFLKPEEGDVVVRIKDPNRLIHEFEYLKPGGESQQVMTRDDDSGMTVLSSWGEKPASDTSLRITLKTPKAMARHSFKLTDVPLP